MAIEAGRLPTEEELLALLANGEDQTTERKSKGDTGDTLKTLVAFANSTPVGFPAVLFVGVYDDGRIQGMTDAELDSAQKSLRREAEKAYPPIPYFPRIVSSEGTKCLAVVVPGSPDRPHFAGPSYVRKGSESPKASGDQFAALISDRSNKVRLIGQEIGKRVDAKVMDNTIWRCSVEEVTSFWVVLRPESLPPADCIRFSVLLERVELAFSPQRESLLLVIDNWFPAWGH